jgi:hypothetical protein
MKRPQKLAVMLVPTPPYEICGLMVAWNCLTILPNRPFQRRSTAMAAFSRNAFFCRMDRRSVSGGPSSDRRTGSPSYFLSITFVHTPRHDPSCPPRAKR